MKQRIAITKRTNFGLKTQMSSRYVRIQTKGALYKMLIRPLLPCGSECWLVTRKDENILRNFEIRILIMIYGPNKKNGVWRSKFYLKVYNLYIELGTRKVIKARRLKCLGCKCTMQEQELCRKLPLHKPEGTRRIVRPARGWLDTVEGLKKWELQIGGEICRIRTSGGQ